MVKQKIEGQKELCQKTKNFWRIRNFGYIFMIPSWATHLCGCHSIRSIPCLPWKSRCICGCHENRGVSVVAMVTKYLYSCHSDHSNQSIPMVSIGDEVSPRLLWKPKYISPWLPVVVVSTSIGYIDILQITSYKLRSHISHTPNLSTIF